MKQGKMSNNQYGVCVMGVLDGGMSEVRTNNFR